MRGVLPGGNWGGGYKPLCYLAIIFLAVLYIYFGSALNPLATNIPNNDVQIWIYIASGMQDGLIPYTDMFDHKGLFLYLIYWAGLFIGGGAVWGIWILAVLFTLTAMFCCYKTVKHLTTSDEMAFASTLLMTSAFGLYYSFSFEESKEVFALPLIFIALYIWVKHLDGKDLTASGCLILGLTLGCVIMITPTLATLWLVILPWLVLGQIHHRQYRNLGISIIMVLLGTAMAVIPQILYLLSAGAFEAFIDAYLLFNIHYAGFSSVLMKLSCLEGILVDPYIIFSELVLVFAVISRKLYEKRSTLIWFGIIYLLITILIISFGGIGYHGHYIINVLPCLCIPFAWGLQEIHRKIRDAEVAYNPFIPVMLCVCIIGAGGFGMAVYGIYHANTQTMTGDEARVIETINACCGDGDTILVMAHRDIFYTATGKQSGSRFSFVNEPIFSKYQSEYLHDIQENKPAVLVRAAGITVPDEITEAVSEDYAPIQQLDTYTIFIRKEKTGR